MLNKEVPFGAAALLVTTEESLLRALV